MLCQNCNRTIDEDAKFCPHCNAKVDKDIVRCPLCWTKHDRNIEICTKCGCNIPKTMKENEDSSNKKAPTFSEKIKALPKLVKYGVPALAIIIIICVSVLGIVSYAENKARTAELAEEFAVMAENAVEKITVIAEHYENDVYNKDWITHIETAAELREKLAPQIEEVKKTREPIGYKRDCIVDIASNPVITIADDVYYGYVECYAYVIGENGKYPHYLKNYKKLTDKFENDVKNLREIISQ